MHDYCFGFKGEDGVGRDELEDIEKEEMIEFFRKTFID